MDKSYVMFSVWAKYGRSSDGYLMSAQNTQPIGYD